MNYISIKEVAKKWNISSRRVQFLCKENRVPGAKKLVMFGLFQTISVNLQICEKEKCMENLYSP